MHRFVPSPLNANELLQRTGLKISMIFITVVFFLVWRK